MIFESKNQSIVVGQFSGRIYMAFSTFWSARYSSDENELKPSSQSMSQSENIILLTENSWLPNPNEPVSRMKGQLKLHL